MHGKVKLDDIVGDDLENLFDELQGLFEGKHHTKILGLNQIMTKVIIKNLYQEIQKDYELDTIQFKRAYRETVRTNYEVPEGAVFH